MSSLNNGCIYLPGFFQIAYVTNDLDQAMQVLGEQYGIKRYHSMRDIPFDADTQISIATAYVGDTMIEIIEPKGKGTSLYDTVLPSGTEFVIRHHHMGHLFTAEADWTRVQALLAESGHPVVYRGGYEGVLEAIYVDTRPILGHYLEYIYCTPAGLEFMNQAPRN
ncbi:VOC family protein [Pseudomonas citronellolis]|uniref:VOC family protein n=1 Tax=Pseudomonas citronellolis TaxID=53408 RepID=UPI0021BF3685|nr:VOC family protein [Pseudomonas citronellolis]UXJ50291.1 VOC family protein [Pseudomonas citronellolis]